MSKKTLAERLRAYRADPSAFWIKVLQGGIDHLRDFSYDFDKNGERKLLETLKTAPTRIQTVFDVGANVGDWSAVARTCFATAEIHAFELSPATFQTLSARLQGLDIRANNLGLGDQDTDIEFKDYGADSTVNTMLLDAQYHDHKVQPKRSRAHIVRGDSYCADHGIQEIDVLKIDVEGAEHMVMQGFQDMLSGQRIRLIQFEYGYTNGDARFLMRDFYKLLGGAGYAVGKLTNMGVRFQPWNYKLNDFRSGPNFVAIRDHDRELRDTLTRF
jgi:FkbM family methyltransferase